MTTTELTDRGAGVPDPSWPPAPPPASSAGLVIEGLAAVRARGERDAQQPHRLPWRGPRADGDHPRRLGGGFLDRDLLGIGAEALGWARSESGGVTP